MSNSLTLKNIKKYFRQGDNELRVLDDASLNIEHGEIISLVGSSGSGKSTLLQIAGLLDKPDSGEVIINGITTKNITDKERTNLRKIYIGFVYQFHHLLKEFTALENVVLPELIKNTDKKIAREKAIYILDKMGLTERMNHLPAELSGGEQQRVAIARALVGSPPLLLADEPTGNLDPINAEIVLNFFMQIVKELNISVLVVTHNMDIAKQTNRIVTIKDGKIIDLRI
ncbi:MAG: ABC transporter ATP-binding protein [Alphaproteobacteria bacterium]